MSAKFQAPMIQENATGWGPTAMPEIFTNLPYQPFSKSDRLGKISDWSDNQERRYKDRYTTQFGVGLQYAYFHEEDESTFQLVDTSKTPKPLYQRGNRFRANQQRNLRQRRLQQQMAAGGAGAGMQILGKNAKSREKDRLRQMRKLQKQYGGRKFDQKGNMPIRNRDASVQIKAEWAIVEEMDFPRLSKLSLPNVKEGEDVRTCGVMEFYDKAYDRITTKSEKRLARINRTFHKVTTTDDPIIRQISKTKGTVFATDAILSTLMTCTRSSYSWDIIVQRVGNRLFFDKRDDGEFDLLTVSETSNEPPTDDGNSINSPRNLALEATFINHNFSQQVVKIGDEKHSFEDPNPFADPDDEVASVGYRYRRWDLENGIELIARCEHDAVMYGTNGELQFINVKALNEWDSRYSGGIDWRQKLDIQRGAVLANELKNNSCKLSKWTVQAVLAGSDQIKFGYVSRMHVRDSAKHVILGTQQFKPTEFAAQINLSMDNAWGILRCIIDTCFKLKEGKYLIMRDPNKPVILLYDIPNNTFEDSDSGSCSGDDENDEDEEDESNSEGEAEKLKAEAKKEAPETKAPSPTGKANPTSPKHEQKDTGGKESKDDGR